MPLRRQFFRKVTIIGVGLIGGSLGLAIKQRRMARTVVGVSQRQSSLNAAMKNHAVDEVYQDVKKAVAGADLVVLSTPVSIITSMLMNIGPNLKRNCIITDVGSTKVSIVKTAQDYLPGHVFFVGSHPLAGSEKKGVQNARPDLFEGSQCLMTPVATTNKMALERVKRLWIQLGAKVKFISPQEHDRILAFTSHLPHIVAYALMAALPDGDLEYCGQGFKDSTRIAASTPQIWADICLGNSKNIVTGLDEMTRKLAAIRRSVVMQEPKSLIDFFKNAKVKRDKLD